MANYGKLLVRETLQDLIPIDQASFSADGRGAIGSKVAEGLRATENWYGLTQALKSQTDSAFKHEFKIRGRQDPKSQLKPFTTNIDNYRSAVFEVGKDSARFEVPGCTVYRQITFGYEPLSKARIGSADYIVVDKADNIVAVGFKTEEAKEIFKQHLFGRELTPGYKQRIRDLHRDVFDHLRSDPESREKLDQFLDSRGYTGYPWADEGRFAYFNPAIRPKIDYEEIRANTEMSKRLEELLEAKEAKRLIDNPESSVSVSDILQPPTLTIMEYFQVKYGYSDKEMFDGGYYNMSFSNEGVVTYSPRKGNIVLIPSFNPENEIVRWKIKVCKLKKEGDAKYLTQPDNKSIREEADVHDELHFAHLLKDCKGKHIILTEGELKCFVTYHKAGVVCVGIPGISQVSDTIIKALVDSGAASITVILDNDSDAKGLKNSDGISNADRASYEIVRRLERAGCETARAGTLSDTEEGDKAGIDDLLLTLSDEEAVEHKDLLIQNGKTAEEYAASIGLDSVLNELGERRREINKSVEEFESMIARGGSPKFNKLSEEMQEFYKQIAAQLKEMIDPIEIAYRDRCFTMYGTSRLNLPNSEKFYALKSKPVPKMEKKDAVLWHGKTVPLEKFSSDILICVAYTTDMAEMHRAKDAKDQNLKVSMRDITRAYLYGKADETLEDLIKRGSKVLGLSIPDRADWKKIKGQMTHRTFSLMVLAGHMTYIYPPNDGYKMDIHTDLLLHRATYIDHVTAIPLLIRSNKGTVTTIVSMPSWEALEGIEQSSGGITDQQYASEDESRRRATIRAYLRDPTFSGQINKFNKLVELCIRDLSPNNSNRRKNKKKLEEILKPLGIEYRDIRIGESRTMPSVMYATRNDLYRLIRKTDNHELLMQAVQAGIFKVQENGIIVPRFEGSVLIIPIKDHDRFSLRVVPLEIKDHKSYALPPTQKIAHNLPGVRGIARAMDPTTILYRTDPSVSARGKVIVVAYNELDALALRSVFHKEDSVAVVSLNSDFHPRREVISALKMLKGKRYVFVGCPDSTSRYAGTIPERIPPYLGDLYDFAMRMRRDEASVSGAELECVPLIKSVSLFLREHNGSAEAKAAMREVVLDCSRTLVEIAPKAFGYNGSSHNSVQRVFIKALEAFEKRLYVKKDYTESDMQIVISEIDKLFVKYEALKGWSETHGVALPDTLEGFLQVRYNFAEKMTPDEIMKFSGHIPLLPKKHFRRDRFSGKRKDKNTPEFERAVKTLFSKGIYEAPENLNPVESRWYDLTQGTGRIEYEQKQVRCQSARKLNYVVQKLANLGVLDSTKPITRSVRKIAGTSKYIAFLKVYRVGADSPLEFYDIASTHAGANNCAARLALNELKGVLTKKERELGLEVTDHRRKFENLKKITDPNVKKALEIKRKDYISKLDMVIKDLRRYGLLPKDFVMKIEKTELPELGKFRAQSPEISINGISVRISCESVSIQLAAQQVAKKLYDQLKPIRDQESEIWVKNSLSNVIEKLNGLTLAEYRKVRKEEKRNAARSEL